MVSSHAQTNSSTGISKNYFPHNCDHVDLKSATLAEICFTYFASKCLWQQVHEVSFADVALLSDDLVTWAKFYTYLYLTSCHIT